jgi:hypothetical protein
MFKNKNREAIDEIESLERKKPTNNQLINEKH